MSDDLLSLLLRVNLVLAGAIMLVLAARAPVRHWFGARIAYALWLIPPLAGAMCFVPARTETLIVPAPPSAAPDMIALDTFARPPVLDAAATLDVTLVALALWAGGALLALAVLASRQARFVRALGRLTPRSEWGERIFGAETNAAGPAIVGVFAPIIVAPADFDHRYTAEERAIVLAHERAHLAQGDPLTNALAALLQCLNWFNPLIHLAVGVLRVDQELACDAAAVSRAAPTRRSYAKALLKAHAGAAVPLGCAWPAPTLNAVKERILMLNRALPSRTQILLGASAVALVTTAACAMAWSAQPARIVTVSAPAPIMQESQERVGRLRSEAEGRTGHRHVSDSVSLSGGDETVNAAEIRAEVRRAMEEAREAVVEGRRAIEESALGQQQALEGEQMARTAMEQARQAALEAATLSEAEREQIVREAMEEARAGLAEAREELRRTALVQRDGVAQSEAMRELEHHAYAIAARALDLAEMRLENGPVDPALLAQAEAEIDQHERRIEELADRIRAEQAHE
jgi:beta-lactamase regulating signal transducer with metallopeptidase domain